MYYYQVSQGVLINTVRLISRAWVTQITTRTVTLCVLD